VDEVLNVNQRGGWGYPQAELEGGVDKEGELGGELDPTHSQPRHEAMPADGVRKAGGGVRIGGRGGGGHEALAEGEGVEEDGANEGGKA
jgi:hypothetical protein